MLLIDIKRKLKIENNVPTNNSLNFLSISQSTAFFNKQIFLSRFQLHLIAEKVEERENVNQIMHQEIINDSKEKSSNQFGFHLLLSFMIISNHNHLFMINVNVAETFPVAPFNAHQLFFAWKKVSNYVYEYSQQLQKLLINMQVLFYDSWQILALPCFGEFTVDKFNCESRNHAELLKQAVFYRL